VEDFGAGSAGRSSHSRRVGEIAHRSLKNRKFAQLLYRIVQYYQPRTIVELGTSLGVTACYLAAANPEAVVHTLEGSTNIAEIASQNFQRIGLHNLRVTVGNFDETLPHLLAGLQTVDLAFIDGNHRREPTLAYFSKLRPGRGPHRY